MSKVRVLLVDDEVDFTEVLAKRLRTRDMTVDRAPNGVEGLKLIDENNYDVIILDLNMPEMDGIETLKRLHENDPDQQVIILTGHGTIQKGVEAMKTGATDFLEKPADFQDLMGMIKNAADRNAVLVQEKSLENIESILKEKGW